MPFKIIRFVQNTNRRTPKSLFRSYLDLGRENNLRQLFRMIPIAVWVEWKVALKTFLSNLAPCVDAACRALGEGHEITLALPTPFP